MPGKYHKTAKLYTYSVAWSEKENGYIAMVTEFPTISTRRETEKAALEDARREVAETLYDWFKTGVPIPEPLKKKA